MSLAAANGLGDCKSSHASTATGRRRRWWIENHGDVPLGMVVASSCGDSCCSLPEHCYLRPKIDTATVRKSHGFALEQLVNLGIGQSIGIAIPPDWEPEMFARKMRGMFHSHKSLLYFRWSVRLRVDGILAVRKMGSFGDGLESPTGKFFLRNVELRNDRPLDPPRFCICGCGEQVIGGMLIDGHRRKELAYCLGCGKEFEWRGRACCSRVCRSKFNKIRKALRCL